MNSNNNLYINIIIYIYIYIFFFFFSLDYCDYCDRSFSDTPEKRKNHLNSQQHLINVKNHYNSFKGKQILNFYIFIIFIKLMNKI